jgi:small subunit ribosomal protein S8
MHVSDPIADMLTRVRNAGQAGLAYATIPASRMKIEIARILQDDGFIRGFRLIRDGGQGKIKVALRFDPQGAPVIRGIKRVSRPGLRVYKSVSDLGKTGGRLGIAVVSTSRGVMTDAQARAANIGGEVLAYVW